MLSALKPVSDLQRVQHFDDYDLTANRAGVLSTRQRWRFVRARLAGHALGTLTTCFSLALVTNGLFTASQLTIIGLTFALVVTIGLGSFVLSLRPVFQKDIPSVQGLLRKDFAIPLDSVPFEEIAIGPERFYVRYELYDMLDEGAVYHAYYLKRGHRLGSNLLLSVELIQAAPPEDD
jgi:hypothetical protein